MPPHLPFHRPEGDGTSAWDDHSLWTMTETRPGFLIVHMGGDVDFRSAGRLNERFGQLVTPGAAQRTAPGGPTIIVVFSAVTFFDSSGMSAIVLAWTRLKGMGGRLLLAGLPDYCSRLFERMGLNGVIETYPTLVHAIEAAVLPAS